MELTGRHIYKRAGKRTILEDVSFTLSSGSILGLLGPNGAGKTTLLRIINGIIDQFEGEICENGRKLNSHHLIKMSYLPEERGLYQQMTAKSHLLFLAQLRGLTAKEALQSIDLWSQKLEFEDKLQSPIHKLSKGNQQKIQFAGALLHAPRWVLLDEPFSGLDPVSSDLFTSVITALREEGCGIMFSTHRMDTVETLCDEVLFIHQGRIVLEGKKEVVKHHYGNPQTILKFSTASNVEKIRQELQWDHVQSVGDGNWEVRVDGTPKDVQYLIQYLVRANCELIGVQQVLPGFERIFKEIVNEV